jgi:AMMECR1 domain-containing protein
MCKVAGEVRVASVDELFPVKAKGEDIAKRSSQAAVHLERFSAMTARKLKTLRSVSALKQWRNCSNWG